MKYKHLSVGKKIAVIFAAIAAIIMAFGVFLVSELKLVRAGTVNFTDSTLPRLEYVWRKTAKNRVTKK
ncbi:hypothetical protein ACQKP8_06735 [Photobacterium alginatilyticum]|uniref:hypothetical protein n=1 Tax=Photobacterium alginatilyticum TaxID=1775171 RepID=UPI0040697E8D